MFSGAGEDLIPWVLRLKRRPSLVPTHAKNGSKKLAMKCPKSCEKQQKQPENEAYRHFFQGACKKNNKEPFKNLNFFGQNDFKNLKKNLKKPYKLVVENYSNFEQKKDRKTLAKMANSEGKICVLASLEHCPPPKTQKKKDLIDLIDDPTLVRCLDGSLTANGKWTP